MNYRHFELQLSKESPSLYRARALDDGNVAAEQTFELLTGELKVIEGLRRLEKKSIGASEKREKEVFHIDFGRELYNKVFSGKLGEYFKNCLEEAQKSSEGLRICLRCDESAQELSALPWEFLHNGDDFLITDRNILISRLPSGVKKVKSNPLESILRMLVVVSSPNDPRVTPLNTELEQEVILEAVDKLQRDHKMEVDFTEDATFETIDDYLNEKEYHIVHFTGHGRYDNEEHKGYLILESENEGAREVDNNAVSDLLAGRNVRLVVLSACQSGKTSNKEAYSDLASHLARKNIPAIVAMQYSILDDSAIKFAETFYRTIASGKPVDLALTEARIVMKNAEKSNGLDFATPVLYLSDTECITIGKIKPEASELSNKPMMLADVQIMKKGFVGRRKELRLLQKDFMSDVKRAAIIYGFGGIGKTVLATRLALKMNNYFDGVFGIRCKAATRPEDILNELNAFLNMAGIAALNEVLYKPVPLKVKTASLVGILNQRRFLIILDNFEDCLDEARNSIASPELKEFIQHLLNNTISNTKFIITTRYNFDPLEGRLTGAVEHISLPEMPFPQTVWLMNTYKELANLETKKKQEIYKKIGGHPWTIGQFARHAAVETVDGVLLEHAQLRKEMIYFTLLDKSYSKLDENAKKLLLCASIYQEAVPVEALSWIIGDEKQPSPPVSEVLSKLINWGLIAKQETEKETFYAMHTMVGEFAGQELEKERLDRKKLLIRAAQYYENLAKTTKNLWDYLKARKYYYRAEEWKKANDIVASTHSYLSQWGYIELAITLLNQSIDTTSDTSKAVALGNLANIYYFLGDWKTALKLHTEVKEIFEKEGEKINVAMSLRNLGNIHNDQGNYEEAFILYKQSLDMLKDLGNKKEIASALLTLGILQDKQGNLDEAIKLYQQSLKISKELGDKSIISMALYQFGIAHQQQDNYEEAVKLYQQSLKLEEEIGNKFGIANALHQLGVIHQFQGNYEKAVELYQKCLKIADELGDKRSIAYAHYRLGTIHEYKDEDYTSALEKYHVAFSIFKELNDSNSKIVEGILAKLKEKMGEEAFNKAMEDFGRPHDA